MWGFRVCRPVFPVLQRLGSFRPLHCGSCKMKLRVYVALYCMDRVCFVVHDVFRVLGVPVSVVFGFSGVRGVLKGLMFLRLFGTLLVDLDSGF